MSVLVRNNVKIAGQGTRSMMFAHGFGCDQNMWRFIAPAFEDSFRTVLFDNVGAGGSDLSAFSAAKYSHLHGYADDVVEIGRVLNIKGGIFVGHSVSAMIGVLAAKKAPELFECVVLVGPSPRHIDDDGYTGGFSADQIEELLDFSRQQSYGVVRGHGAGDHGQSRQAGTWPGTDQQLLPDRSRDRQTFCPHNLHVRQPRGSGGPRCAGARAAVQG